MAEELALLEARAHCSLAKSLFLRMNWIRKHSEGLHKASTSCVQREAPGRRQAALSRTLVHTDDKARCPGTLRGGSPGLAHCGTFTSPQGNMSSPFSTAGVKLV